MADVECYWREVSRTGIQLGITQIAAPLFKVFSSEVEGMQDRSLHGGNISESSAQPGLWDLSLGHLLLSTTNYALIRIPKNER